MHALLCRIYITILMAQVIFTSPTRELHCTRTTALQGEINDMDEEGRAANSRSSSVADITLKETWCLNFTDSHRSQLHAIEFLRMEQHFPVIASYKFAIPQLETSCICDCAGAEQYCTMEAYKYKNCSKGALCYRTYYNQQSNSGCLSSAKSEVCCEVNVEPLNNQVYTAVRLNQPDTIVILKHRIFERISNRWIELVSEEFEAVVNKGSAKIENVDERKTEIRASSGRAIREMTEGMYYYKDDDRILMTGARLNQPNEGSIYKLGWLRKENGAWNIYNGVIKITDSQHVTVDNCKGQRYKTQYNADYLVVGNKLGHSTIDLGFRLDSLSWVHRVDIANDERSVRVLHAEGTVVHLTVISDLRPLIVQHSSEFRSFSGSIRLDDKSNRFLNLTINDAKGTIIGYVQRSRDKTGIEFSFSVEIGANMRPTFKATVGGISSEVNSDRYICLHPAGDLEAEQCKLLQYIAEPLREEHYGVYWQKGVGDCPGCNERGIENFLQKLDPREWLNGINTTTELVTCALEIVLVVAAVLLIILICTKCIIPLAKCTICLASTPKIK